MAASKEAEISQLLREGLDCYGSGREPQAERAWRRVLELDPDNELARDFLQSAGRTAATDDSIPAQDTTASVLAEARRQMAEENFEGALAMLRGGVSAGGVSIELEALVELARVHLVRSYRERLGDLTAIPKMSATAKPITSYNLPPNAGFVLSLLDGSTTVQDLISLSGMDAFEALRTLSGLTEAGLVEMQT
jgi:hypothetical protein